MDILINNTGGPPPSTAAGQDPALWAKQFQAMVLSVIAITDRVLPGMKARGWGRILTSTSSGIIAPIPNLAISNALRMSLVGWSKTLAREVAKDGITANIIVPGRIATARVATLDNARAKREGRSVEEVAAESAATIPVGRYGKPEEYADVVAFLASDSCRLHHRFRHPRRWRDDRPAFSREIEQIHATRTAKPSKHSKASRPQPSPRCCSRRVCATSGCAAPSLCAPARPRIVGPAFTLRFVPAREDLATPESWASPISTRAAIEAMPPAASR